MPQLRDFQQQDVRAVVAAHAAHRSVIGRAATGLGKAVELAALAQHYAQFGRVMVLVDVVKLVRQLSKTIEWFTGTAPGVEMAESRAVNGGGGTLHDDHDRVIVSTVQTQWSGAEGKERYRQFDPREFSAVLLDECELFLADKANSVVRYYLDGNPELKVFGCTATPLRTDGVAMAELFGHVAFDRDILWGIDNGWLVPARQAFVRLSIESAQLRPRKNDRGEEDYTDADVAAWLSSSKTLIELAQGVISVAGTRRTIVVCPDVEIAVELTKHLNAERLGCAEVVYGEMGDQDKVDVMDRHQRGEYQFLVSVMMLTKGYDDPEVSCVVNCRKTKSKRLYTQIMGRGVRPLAGLLDGVEDPAERRAAIAGSAKPDAMMVNMVGVDEAVRDVTIVDILGEARDPEVIERAKEIEAEGELDAGEALAMAEAQVLEQQELNRLMAEALHAELEAADEQRVRSLRQMVDVKVRVDVEHQGDLRPTTGAGHGVGVSGVPAGTLGVLRKAGLDEREIAAMPPDRAGSLAQEIIRRHHRGLCTWKQAKILKRNGYTKEQIKVMPKSEATEILDGIFGRRRAREGAGA